MPNHFFKIGDVEVKYDTPDETEIRRETQEIVTAANEGVKGLSRIYGRTSKPEPEPYRPNLEEPAYCGDGICAPSRNGILTRSEPVGVSSLDAAAGLFTFLGLPIVIIILLVVAKVLEAAK